MWFAIIILTVLATMLDFYRKKQTDKKLNIGGRRVFPILGNVPQYMNSTPEDLIQLIEQDTKDFGGLCCVWIFNKMEVFVTDPIVIERILNNKKHTARNQMYDLLRPWLKKGLFLSSGARWIARRKIVTPAFHISNMEQFIQIFDEQSNILIEKFRPHAEDGKPFDISSYITLAALDIATETFFGVKINAQKDPECPYLRALHEFIIIGTERFINLTLRPPLLFSILAPRMKRRLDESVKTLHSFSKKIIKDRRELLQRNGSLPEDIPGQNGQDSGSKKRMALLDIFLQASIDGKRLSDEDIQEEVDGITFGAHDTTASCMNFTLYLISRYSEVQRKIFEEIQEVFGNDKTRPATCKDLQQLKYIELVIKESLRMYPVAPIFGRVLGEDLNIEDKIIPAGTSVTIIPLLSMKNPKYFPDPHKFIPERHSVEARAESQNSFAYIPFSAGPRACMGQRYGIFEMKSFISKILRHYELLPIGEDMELRFNIILGSQSGFQMGLKFRDNCRSELSG